jgi:hypothetical protein
MIRKLSEDIATDRDMKASEKFRAILQEVKDGRAENITQRQAISAQLIQVLGNMGTITQDITALEAMINQNQQDVIDAFARLNLPKNVNALGINMDICGREYYKNNQGLILLHIINNAINNSSGNYNLDTPVKSSPITDPPIKISAFLSKLGYSSGNKAKWPVSKGFLDIPNCDVLTLRDLTDKLVDAKHTGRILRYNIDFSNEVIDDAGQEPYIYEITSAGVDITDNVDLTTDMDGSLSSKGVSSQSSSSSSQSSSSSSQSSSSSSSLSSPQRILKGIKSFINPP